MISYTSNSHTFIPKTISRSAIATYILALLTCSLLFSKYSLTWYWMVFGLVEVIGFFYFIRKLLFEWQWLSPKTFEKKLFSTSLAIRLLYVFFSYWFYYEMTGTEFEIGAADVFFYHDSGKIMSEHLRHGEWNLMQYMLADGGVSFSDTGYIIYLSFIYFFSDDSIIVVRLLKAVWSAWTVLLTYKLAVRYFGESTARIAALLCMLMPNLIYYCGLHLKETEMVFLAMLYAERIDFLIRDGKLKVGQIMLLMLIPVAMFTIRTALAAVMVLAFGVTLLFGNSRLVSGSKRIVLIVFMALFSGVVILGGTRIGRDVIVMLQTKNSQQEGNMEWRANRKDSHGRVQKFARYAGAAVFAPMIFTIPFPTMVETDGQENQKMIHGGNFDKNITSFFTILSLFVLLISGDWRKYVLPASLLVGYLVVLVFSNFAQSERFHLPSIPFSIMFAAYGISLFGAKRKYQQWFKYWCVLMFVAAIVWNWFKLAGRGMI